MEALVAIVLVLVGLKIAISVARQSTKSQSPAAIPSPHSPVNVGVASIEERLAAAAKQVGLFMEASMLLVNKEALKQDVPKLGTRLYLVGAVDALTQHYKLGDDNFVSATFGALRGFGLNEEGAHAFFKNLPALSQDPFANHAISEGGKTILAWLSGKDRAAPVRLSELVREWAGLSDSI